MSKICKQCGRQLGDDAFRSYKPRGRGVYKTTVGTNTICKECESFNSRINYVYKLEERTEAQEQLLVQAKEFYTALKKRGLEPKGAYAKYILGEEAYVDTAGGAATKPNGPLEFMQAIMYPNANPLIISEYDRLCTIELTDEPDVYQDMLDKVRDKSVGPNGRILPEYLAAFNKAAQRIDDYEDHYVWE